MNSHPVANEDLMAYLDGELSPSAAAEIATHLAQCRSCQHTAADLQGVGRQLARWTVETPEPHSLPPRVLAAFEDNQSKPASKTHHWLLTPRALSFEVMALGVIVLGIVGSISQHPSRSHIRLADLRLTRQEPIQFEPIARAAELHLTAANFDTLRSDLDRAVRQFGGHIAQLDISSASGQPRSLTAILLVPAPQLEPALSQLRQFGRVDAESQRAEDVARQSVDTAARLANARYLEQRLSEILRTRTGKLSDIVEIEQKLAAVRGQIEQTEAEQKLLSNRGAFASVSLNVAEKDQSSLSLAALDGVHNAFEGTALLARVLLEVLPSLLLFSLLLGLPAYFVWKKFRR